MNWYKKAQFLRQDLTVSPESFSSSLPQSQEVMEKLGLEKILTDFAVEKQYQSPIDYVLCSLYPELEQKCRSYYTEHEKNLKDVTSKMQLQK